MRKNNDDEQTNERTFVVNFPMSGLVGSDIESVDFMQALDSNIILFHVKCHIKAYGSYVNVLDDTVLCVQFGHFKR